MEKPSPIREKLHLFLTSTQNIFKVRLFFIFNADIHRIELCDIGVRDISDHAGVYLTFHLDNDRKETLWRFNLSLLSDDKLYDFVQKEYNEFLQYNESDDISPSILWDTAKAVLRGKLQTWSVHKKRERECKIKDLNNDLKALEKRHMETNEPSILSNIEHMQQELNKMQEYQIEKRLKLIKQTYYENSSKSKKLLAWKIRKQQTDRFMQKVTNPTDNKIYHKLKDIKTPFEIYYTQLYKQLQVTDESNVKDFLSSLDLPSIGTEQNKILTQL